MISDPVVGDIYEMDIQVFDNDATVSQRNYKHKCIPHILY